MRVNASRPLTHSLDLSKEGLAVDATRQERWLPIPGYEDAYEVSDQGRVRSIDRVTVHSNGFRQTMRGKMMSLNINSHGYLSVTLSKRSKMIPYRVHSLVLSAFVGPRPAGMVTRHLDGNKLNNKLENLTWGTQAENIRDVLDHGNHFQKNQTHCVHGHEYTERNTLRRTKKCGKKYRFCRTCKNEQARIRYANSRLAAADHQEKNR